MYLDGEEFCYFPSFQNLSGWMKLISKYKAYSSGQSLVELQDKGVFSVCVVTLSVIEITNVRFPSVCPWKQFKIGHELTGFLPQNEWSGMHFG